MLEQAAIDQATRKEAFHTAISSLPINDQTATVNDISQQRKQEGPDMSQEERERQARRTRAMNMGHFLHPPRAQGWQSMIDTLSNDDDLRVGPATLQSDWKPKGRDQTMSHISLDQRLSRLAQGYSSDPGYALQVLRAAADLSIGTLVRSDSLVHDIAWELCISDSEAASMTYDQLSVILHNWWKKGYVYQKKANEVMCCLMGPFFLENKRRARRMNIPSVIKEKASGQYKATTADEAFRAREIELADSITTPVAMELIRQMRCLAGQDAEKPITLLINSYGGEVVAGLSIYDTMRALPCPVNTICVGAAYSMASLLFAAGAHRAILPSANVMVHDPLIGGSGVTGNALSVEAMVVCSLRFCCVHITVMCRISPRLQPINAQKISTRL